MSQIVLCTLNARYWHSSFGLRYLKANLEELSEQAQILEFVINDNLSMVLETILKQKPQIVGFGVYIWNIEQTEKLVRDLKRLRPGITVVLGGPEVSYETEQQRIVQEADYTITGEADITFRELCRLILAGDRPASKIIRSPVPPLDQVKMPYHLYGEEEILHRVIYVEASRGCPFTCEFCLSSLEIPVRQFDIDLFLSNMQSLYDRGVRQFKFVDRTFNLSLRIGRAILQFFLDRYEPGLFLHFEMIPDRLPDAMRELIAQFPPGVLQFEIGIQTFNQDVGKLISRKQDYRKLADNFRFLRQQTGVHIHADLIVGLPGESVESFGNGFDRLLQYNPQEIQVGMLKRLKGTPITRHDDEWEMVYSSYPPYEILSTKLITFEQMQRMRRFAKYWDLIANSGNFIESRNLLWENQDSPFHQFLAFSDWLYKEQKRTHGISLIRLCELLFRFMTELQQKDQLQVAQTIWSDYTRNGREDRPHFLRKFDLPHPKRKSPSHKSQLPRRQARHGQNEEQKQK